MGFKKGQAIKVKVILDINVTMGGVSHDGTGRQVYLPEGTRYSGIVRVFGEPQFGKSLFSHP